FLTATGRGVLFGAFSPWLRLRQPGWDGEDDIARAGVARCVPHPQHHDVRPRLGSRAGGMSERDTRSRNVTPAVWGPLARSGVYLREAVQAVPRLLAQGIQTTCRSMRITPSSSAASNSLRSARKYRSAAAPGEANATKWALKFLSGSCSGWSGSRRP